MAPQPDGLVRVSVVYARPRDAVTVPLELPAGATVGDAVEHATPRIRARCPGAAWTATGVYGKRVPHDRKLVDGDRVELYRALVADPKDARRVRARKARG